MFGLSFATDQQAIKELNDSLDTFSEQVRNVAMRAGCKAATEIFKKEFNYAASSHRSNLNPPLRREHGVYIVRPHLADSFTSKIWKIPDNSGFIGYAGPLAKEEPHAHLLEEGTDNRYTKTGAFRGAGPAYHLRKIAFARGVRQAESAFISAATEKLKQYMET